MAKKRSKKSAGSSTNATAPAAVTTGGPEMVQQMMFASWDEFKAFLVTLYGNDEFRRDRFLFRGQGRSSWKLESTFDRQFPVLQYDKGERLDTSSA